MFDNPTKTNPKTTENIPPNWALENLRLKNNDEIIAVNITMKPFSI